MTRYSRTGLLMIMLAAASPLCLAAQVGAPRGTALVGFGNAMGWVGAQVEVYFGGGRFSGFGGFGVMPNLVSEEGTGPVGALGVRAFTAGNRHRGLVEISVSALSNSVTSTFPDGVVEKRIGYGPGVALGYQFIGTQGLTFMLSGGAGLGDPTIDPEGSRVLPMVGIGVGYSWR